jgi:hypothetical protein
MLSVNQSDLKEKNHQVSLMQTINTRVLSLIVWLGAASDESSDAIDFISSTSQFTLEEEMLLEKLGWGWSLDCGSNFKQFVKGEAGIPFQKSSAEQLWDKPTFASLEQWEQGVSSEVRHQTTQPTNSQTDIPWGALLSFLSRRYWQRLWIIQELALNHHMTLFLCSERQLSRNMIWRACEFCMRHADIIDQISSIHNNAAKRSSTYT